MLIARNWKELLIITGLLITLFVILKIVFRKKYKDKFPSLQELIDRGIHPTIRKKKIPKINGGNGNKKNNMKD